MTTSIPAITDEQIEAFYANHSMPTTGDATALFQAMLQATWVGLVGDPDTPPMVGATLEMVYHRAELWPVERV